MNTKLFFPLILLLLNNCISLAGILECKAGLYSSLAERAKFLNNQEFRNEFIANKLPVVHVTNNISIGGDGKFYLKAGAIYNESEEIASTEQQAAVPIPRGTLHFTLGGMVVPFGKFSWAKKKIAVVTTIGALEKSGGLVSLHPHDTYVGGNYKPGENDIIVASIDFLKLIIKDIKIGYTIFEGQTIYAYDSNVNNLEEALTQVFEKKNT